MIVFSIDPGNIQSGWCIVDGETNETTGLRKDR